MSAAQGIPAGSFLLLFGRLADIFGRKKVLMVSLMSHAAGGVVCGISNHMYPPVEMLLNLDMFSILDERCKGWLVLDLSLLGLAFWQHCIDPADVRIVYSLHSARRNL